ncbi:MAG: hypothetical protein E7K90_22015, partial [Hafnia alvei]|nr:hypothetical protein [Hafnia alvei]
GQATDNGKLPAYTLKETDAGNVLEVSVLAKNGAGVTGNTATVTTDGTIIPRGEEAPASVNTQVNDYIFTTTSEEGTFPTTGFTGATFTIVPKDSKKATNYTWTANALWVSVTDGVVKFTAKGSGSKVTVTGTPKSGPGKMIKYSFTLKSWFINENDSSLMDWSSANKYCLSLTGYSLPTVGQVSNMSSDGRRGIGALWYEWGRLSNYPGTGFSSGSIWTLEPITSDSSYTVDLYSGGYSNSLNSNKFYVMCRQSL